MERVKRIELSSSAWEAAALPLSYTRINKLTTAWLNSAQAGNAHGRLKVCLIWKLPFDPIYISSWQRGFKSIWFQFQRKMLSFTVRCRHWALGDRKYYLVRVFLCVFSAAIPKNILVFQRTARGNKGVNLCSRTRQRKQRTHLLVDGYIKNISTWKLLIKWMIWRCV